MPLRVKQRVIDRGLSRIIKDMYGLRDAHVKVGFPEKGEKGIVNKRGIRKPDREMSDVIYIAAIHEYGAPKANIPPRPFVSTSYDEHKQPLQKIKASALGKIIDGTLTVRKALEDIGEVCVTWMKKKIESNIPPMSARAVRDSGITLIDTGQMINSIQYEVEA
jgi:hypothetical protein